jgi:hypothetical protein
MKMVYLIPVATMLMLVLTAGAQADEGAGSTGTAGPAADLQTLRQEIEVLRGDLDRKRAASQARLELLVSRRTELELEIKRAEAQFHEQKVVEQKRSTRERDSSSKDLTLTPALRSTCVALREYVQRSLPFKTQERLREVDNVCGTVESGGAPSRAIPRLWSLIEDEMRLTHENGLFHQVVRVGETESLADVARVGMIALFYLTADGSVGSARKNGDVWQFVPISASDDEKLVSKLFDSFRKGVRVGSFVLPGHFASLRQVRTDGGGVQ